MLGKTNITAIEGGVIVSDIEDYRWDRVRIEGVTGAFVRAIYENDMLVAITKDGTIIYSRDGENWTKMRLDIEGTYELADIIWDGRRYVMVGSREEIVEQEYIYHGFIAVTENLMDFNIIHAQDEYSRYYAVIEKDGKYIVISKESYTNANETYGCISANTGSIENWDSHLTKVISDLKYRIYINSTTTGNDYAKVTCECKIIVVKNNRGGLLYVWFSHKGDYSPTTNIYWTPDWHIFENNGGGDARTNGNNVILSGFECRGKAYFCYTDKRLVRVDTDTGEKFNIGATVNYTDALYYDKCEIYLNEYGIVVVRNGENVNEKSLDDLIEITYDFSMELIVKAFAGLYIFGTGCNILKSNSEVNNEEALAVKTMSASKALYDARNYTDEKYNALEARIAALETAGMEL